ncbi:MAG TPA: GPP34 family phosphoprotein [bacterium]|nr:GPP34 family phosphoprotein [Candidatus Omnitrophota bacterium]HOJ62590.1 GPP34 family phosphoprotein [bacterium]HOL94925.1 GPP34 family phosphoprotein [bacterium]HPO99369.1 GPP34 family phosphoprotein [bacterium]HXK93429.1 GPP34 family phosphoprotein [bacterium]
MFNLAEDFYLLALDGEKGSLSGQISMTVPYLTAGAILNDLGLRDRIHLENGLVKVTGPAVTEDPVLDRAWEVIAQSGPLRSPGKWVRLFAKQYKEFQELIVTRLLEHRVVKREEKRILGIFPVKRYPLRRKRYKRELVRQVRSAILRNRKPDERMRGMIRLIHLSGLISRIFPREDQRKAKEKVQALLKEENLSANAQELESTLSKILERAVAAGKTQRAILHSGG